MVFLIPPLPRHIDPSTIIPLQHPNQTNDFKTGDVVSTWDRLFLWDDDCVPASQLEAWSKDGDLVVDDFLASLPASSLAHRDLLQLVLEKTLKEGTGEKGLARRLWDELTETAPEGVGVSEEDVRVGQLVFWGNVGGIFAGLMHFSLAGGFSSPSITASLHKASYLIPPSGPDAKYLPITPLSAERTITRLHETGQFVIDAMGAEIPVPESAPESEKAANALRITSGLAGLSPPPPSFPPSLKGAGEGWKSAVRVRLLHGVVRRRIRMKNQRLGEGVNEQGEEVVPLNVEEMAGTLSSFAVAPIWSLETLGVRLSLEEKTAYLRTWRHIGFLLGIPPPLLARHFSDYTPSSKFLCSIVCHLFPSRPPPSSPDSSLFVLGEQTGVLPPPTMAILDAISNRPPFSTSLDYHFNMTRLLIGHSLADYLGIPQTIWKGALKLRLSILLLTYSTHFASYYPSQRWRDKRISLVKDGMGRVLRMGLGRRKSVFRPREEGTGGLSENARREEEVKMDPEGGMKMYRAYRVLILEMAVVSVASALATTALGWVVVSRAVSFVAVVVRQS